MTDFSSGFFGNKSVGLGNGPSDTLIKKRSYVNLIRGKLVDDPFTDTYIIVTNMYSSRWNLTGDPPPKYIDLNGQVPIDLLEKDYMDDSFELPEGFALGSLFSIFLNDSSVGPMVPKKVLCAPVFTYYFDNEDDRENIKYHLMPNTILPILGALPTRIGVKDEKDIIVPCYMLLAC